MDWKIIDHLEILDELIEKSNNFPQIIFKHSTRCAVSSLALNRLSSKPTNKNYYIVDIMSHKDISNELASRFKIVHQSPQLLMIHNGVCVHDTSHLGISKSWVEKKIKGLEI